MSLKSEKEKFEMYLSFYNREAKVEFKDKVYLVTEKDFLKLNIRGNYWHSKTDPSSWLTANTVRLLARKFKKSLPRPQIIELAAQILNVSSSQIEGTLDWNARYTSWRDGEKPDDYHVLPDKE